MKRERVQDFSVHNHLCLPGETRMAEKQLLWGFVMGHIITSSHSKLSGRLAQFLTLSYAGGFQVVCIAKFL